MASITYDYRCPSCGQIKSLHDPFSCKHCGWSVDSMIRQFDTGANRDTADGKLEYIGFICPVAMKRFAQYMHANRTLKDGTLRESNNWKKGIPIEVYWQSLGRHFFEAWRWHDSQDSQTADIDPVGLEDTLCAIMFNVQGLLRELLLQGSASPGQDS